MAERDLFWSLQEDRALAVRRGPWKLVRQGEKAELYNLEKDLKESTDVAAGHPERVKELQAALDAWKTEVRNGATVQPPPPAGTTGRKRPRKKTK